jgi:integrase
VDLLQKTIEVAETFSEGQFGSPKTRSSKRVIPKSSFLCDVLKSRRTGALYTTPEDLVFCTHKGTPLNPKNLYNRELAPASDRIKEPRVSWHSFRHAHATLFGDVGASLKTAQAQLGHPYLETTLSIYTHPIPESQREAVERASKVVFSNVLKLEGDAETARVN